MSYAIVWSENEELKFAGRLDLTPGGVVLTGTGTGVREVVRTLRYGDLTSSHLQAAH